MTRVPLHRLSLLLLSFASAGFCSLLRKPNAGRRGPRMRAGLGCFSDGFAAPHASEWLSPDETRGGAHQIKFIEIPAEVEGNPHNPYVTEGSHEYATGFGGHVAKGKGENSTSMF
jgi:hypothetical protein